MTGPGDLRRERSRLARAWDRYVGRSRAARTDAAEEGGSPGGDSGLRPEILASWERSADQVDADTSEAPLADPDDTTSTWEGSPLRQAVARLEPELRRAAEDGDLVVAVTDERTRILWTYGGRVMRRRAEAVNFVPGGRWDEASVGTNALDLAMRVDGPTSVYSAEHYAPIVHGWVCWAAPVHDPATGRALGVLDLSTTWDRAHPIGTATAQALARLLEREIGPATGGSPGRGAGDAPGALAVVQALDTGLEPAAPGTLDLRLLGTVEARADGTRLLLTRRQAEILALLVLHPEGLSVESLHAMLYGDATVSTSTLKAEVSHLRSVLGGRISSRPYRVTMPVRCDVTQVLDRVAAGDVAGAVAAYGGDLLPGTESPALGETADYVAVAVRESLLADPQPDAVLAYARSAPYDVEVVERALERLGTAHHPARALLRARLAAASRG